MGSDSRPGHVAFQRVVAIEALELEFEYQLVVDWRPVLREVVGDVGDDPEHLKDVATRSQSRVDSSVLKPTTSRQYSPA